MALNKYAIRVDPQGQAVTVDVLDMAGVSVAVFESQQFGAAKRTLPLTITAPTDFWLQTAGTFDVSCKVGGSEVADAGRARRVQVSDVPTLVVPDWERQRAASSGGSSAVAWTAVKTADYAASSGDAVPADASGGDFNVTLPVPAANGRVTVKNVGATGTVTVLPHGSETIDGGSSNVISTQWASRDYQSDGDDWLVI